VCALEPTMEHKNANCADLRKRQTENFHWANKSASMVFGSDYICWLTLVRFFGLLSLMQVHFEAFYEVDTDMCVAYERRVQFVRVLLSTLVV